MKRTKQKVIAMRRKKGRAVEVSKYAAKRKARIKARLEAKQNEPAI